MTFPSDFYWGTATAAYQIEGGWNADGKGESIWDRFSHTPGKILDGSTGDIACDHYHRWAEDIRLMGELGVNAYRFSISWPRVLPEGRGRLNPAGLDFYNRLVDGLLEAGITPFVTLYHWDLPQALQDEGGWPNRQIAEAFVEFADLASRRLGDRVKNWITHNEPSVAAYLGYGMGIHAPGIQDPFLARKAAHHLLLSHGWAVPLIRRNSPGAEVGIALNLNYSQPASASAADYNAWRLIAGEWDRWYLDPLYHRGYPLDLVESAICKGDLPPDGLTFVQPGDLEAISVHTDFLGLNYYTRHIHRAPIPEENNLPPMVQPASPGAENYTEMGWEIYPDGLFCVLAWLAFGYQITRIYITENGASYSTSPGPGGIVPDHLRTQYLRKHVAVAGRALQFGIPLKGYFVWSLMDNFEWAQGYTQRFGLFWVDFVSQQRILKDSGKWYRDLITGQKTLNFFTSNG